MKTLTVLARTILFVTVVCLGFVPQHAAQAADAPDVQMKASGVGPRELEPLTSQRLVRDYRNAWQSFAEAIASGSPAPLDGHFVASAKEGLVSVIADQHATKLHARYLDQKHSVEPVFYSPEGDVIELHDTTTCHLQLLDGDKLIHDEQLVLHYVVLMTPEADRWVVRQLQSVPEF